MGNWICFIRQILGWNSTEGCGSPCGNRLPGANEIQIGKSITMGSGKGWRIDTENPKPGVRAGNMHLQDYAGDKYNYNFETGQFEGLSNAEQKRLMKYQGVQKAINQGLNYLGMNPCG